MNEYILAIGIFLIGYAIVRFSIYKVLKSTEKFGPESINVSACPICGSLDSTTTAEDTSRGLKLKCKDCKYAGTMLEMNLVQAKKYEMLKSKKEK